MKKQISFSRLILVIPIIGLFLLPSFLSASDPIQIGETNCPYALAYSNARKIVRTSFGRLVVVFQDSVEHKPVVKWTYSDDGVSWSEPELLGRGSQPALTIGKDDMIYNCMIYEDGLKIAINSLAPDTTAWNTKYLRLVVWPADRYDLKHPGIEVTEHSVNLVYQATQNGSPHIYYQRYSRDLSQCLSSFINFSSADKSAEFPVIVGDLEFEKDRIYVFWSTPPTTQQPSKIHYGLIEENITNNSYEIMLGSGGELPFSGMTLYSDTILKVNRKINYFYIYWDQIFLGFGSF